MTKKKIIRKDNRSLNIFANGGDTQTLGLKSSSLLSDSFKGDNLGSSIGGIGSSVGNIINASASNAKIADTSAAESGIKALNNMTVGATNLDSLMSEWGSWNKSKDDYSYKDVRGGSTGQRLGNTLSSTASGAATGALVGGPIGAIVGGVVGLGSSVAGWITGNKKAKRKSIKLNELAREANNRALSSFETRAGNIDTLNDFKMLANYAAYGGFMPMSGSQAIDYELANKDLNNKELNSMSKFRITSLPNSFESISDFLGLNTFAEGGSIHIKPLNRGKFTEYCGGKVTSSCISKGKHSSSPAVRKRATFAENARHWKHAFGGNLYSNVPNTSQHGGEFSNGVTLIGEGGTHELNPLEGVPMGTAPDGTPNLVELGEVKFNDYIFSNRLFADGGLLDQFSLSPSYNDNSFAMIAEKINKESSERPNDPISKRGLLAGMSRLMQALELIKSKDNPTPQGQLFADGGKITGLDTTLLDNRPFTWDDYIASTSYDPLIENSSSSDLTKGIGLDALRYAPAIGSGVASITDALGVTNKPNYNSADMITDAVSGLPTIEGDAIGNYLSYNPFDRDYYINKLNANAAATRRGVTNTSGGNRLNALAGILAADYNYGLNLGDLARKAEEYNMQQRQQVEGFNRGTNQFNSELGLKTAMANQQTKELQLKGIMTAALMKDNERARTDAAKDANLSGFFDSLGSIGLEEFMRNMINSDPSRQYKINRSGKTSYKGKNKTKGGGLI